MTGKLPAVRVASEKTVEIPIGHMSSKSIANETIPAHFQTNQSQKDDASQSEGMSHNQMTVLLPPGLDCVAGQTAIVG